MIKEKILKALINKWGTEKFVKIVAMSFLGAGVSGLIAEHFIPNNPDVIINNEKGEI